MWWVSIRTRIMGVHIADAENMQELRSNGTRKLWGYHPHKAKGIKMTDTPMPEQDISKCPRCGGYADNGFDRCHPPSPYCCTKCQDIAPMPELKPCPFCGGEATKTLSGKVVCKTAQLLNTDCENVYPYSDDFWNTRAETPEVAALRESHRELLDVIHHANHKIPKPKEMCERIRFITVIKNKDGALGYSSSGSLPDDDVLKAMGINWQRYLSVAFEKIKAIANAEKVSG